MYAEETGRCKANPELAKTGNIRDFADILHLNVLANLERLNSVMIKGGTSNQQRFDLLAKTEISQYQRPTQRQGLKELEG